MSIVILIEIVEGPFYCLIDPMLLKHYEESHRVTKAQSENAHIDRMHGKPIRAVGDVCYICPMF